MFAAVAIIARQFFIASARDSRLRPQEPADLQSREATWRRQIAHWERAEEVQPQIEGVNHTAKWNPKQARWLRL